jgi:hypothetical protein
MPRRLLALLVPLALFACRNDRPVECQRLRQCCTAASGSGAEVETVRVACTRVEESDAVLCRRRLEEVVAAVPGMESRPECRLAQ